MPFDFKSVPRSSWIAIGGLAGLTAAFMALGLIPYLLAAERLNHEIQGYRTAMEQAAAQSEQLRDLTARDTHMVREVRNYPRLVPKNNDLGLFLGQLSHELDASGMRDTAVRALPPNNLGKCSQLPIEVRGSGTFVQFNDFLQRLEALPRMSSVSKLEVKADDAMSGKVTVDVTLSIYSTRENQ